MECIKELLETNTCLLACLCTECKLLLETGLMYYCMGGGGLLLDSAQLYGINCTAEFTGQW
jgi:hypothetical protein